MDDDECVKRLFHTLKNYQEDTINRLSYMQKSLTDSSLKHKNLLLQAGLGSYLDNLLNCVEANQSVINDILQVATLSTLRKIPYRKKIRLANVFFNFSSWKFFK